jgi:anthranilate/para-aminobenzoate synthase component II
MLGHAGFGFTLWVEFNKSARTQTWKTQLDRTQWHRNISRFAATFASGALSFIQPQESVQSELQIDATCEGEIMGVSCPAQQVWAVQFHPESILTPQGHKMMANWLSLCAQSQL